MADGIGFAVRGAEVGGSRVENSTRLREEKRRRRKKERGEKRGRRERRREKMYVCVRERGREKMRLAALLFVSRWMMKNHRESKLSVGSLSRPRTVWSRAPDQLLRDPVRCEIR